MRTFKKTGEIRQYAQKHFDVRLTSMDVCNLRRRHAQPVGADERLAVEELLQPEGCYRICSKLTTIGSVYFAPKCMYDVCGEYCEVLLADATHQLNNGGYVLWHAMIIDAFGIGRSVFYALLSNETYDSYVRAVECMLTFLPCLRRCRTVVIDRSLAQLNAFRTVLSWASVVLCRFHVLKDMRLRCSRLPAMCAADKRRIYQWMSNLVHSRDESTFENLLRAIAARSDAARCYLNRAWLPFKSNWAGHLLQHTITLGNWTTNRVENENRHLKAGLSKHSSVFDVLNHLIERVRLSNISYGVQSAKGHMSVLRLRECPIDIKPMVERLSAYAQRVFLDHYKRTEVVSVSAVGAGFRVATTKSRLFRVHLGAQATCDCTFSVDFLLPCAHIVAVALQTAFPLPNLVDRCRWLMPMLPLKHIRPMQPSTSTYESAPLSQSISLGDKVRMNEDVTADLNVVLNNLGGNKHRKQYSNVRLLVGLIANWPDVDLHCSRPGKERIVRITGRQSIDDIWKVSSCERQVDVGMPSCRVFQPAASVTHNLEDSHMVDLTNIELPQHMVHQPKFRRISSMTSKTFRLSRMRRLLARRPTSPKNEDVCHICKRETDEGLSGSVEWVQCDRCDRWCHQVCGNFPDTASAFICVNCVDLDQDD